MLEGTVKGGRLPPPCVQACGVAAAAQSFITPPSSPALAETGLSSRRAPLPAMSISDLLIVAMQGIWRNVYVRWFAELHTLVFVLADLLHHHQVP